MVNRSKARRDTIHEQHLREKVDIGGVRSFFDKVALMHPDKSGLAIVCIGTDRSTGDSFGPWIGTMLEELGWPVVRGTLKEPWDSTRYEASVLDMPASLPVIAIDACLGKIDDACRYLISEGPLYPARAVGKNLPPIGNYSLEGIVAPLSVKPYWSLQSASLYEVIDLARAVTDAIHSAWRHK
ncbi:hypothetical protein Back11_31510 [Paenibacillus baekrokdamisoli]|uniref:Uncharacterized protein n=1 Tax=Paenibacillus baekrokdamisoli TaxID=1712516 RepID=A0A3G9ITU3_9BACL|nr:spore protease YyaC [Paenibacillus baekrokdamisoli]MBB3071685.1 putative sporulation protein YyaC [Paenibacillus baekrokdamisoli]BBH21806.1 hypothetical protein Back11_31510 [Paenibacillus baekrokdamisoli]